MNHKNYCSETFNMPRMRSAQLQEMIDDFVFSIPLMKDELLGITKNVLTWDKERKEAFQEACKIIEESYKNT